MRSFGMHMPSTRPVPSAGSAGRSQPARRHSLRFALRAASSSGPPAGGGGGPDRDPTQSPRQPEVRTPRLASAELRARLLRNRERASRAGMPSQPLSSDQHLSGGSMRSGCSICVSRAIRAYTGGT